MTKRRGRKSIDRPRHREYQRVAQHFYEAARDSMALEYWTAAGVLIVHASIAYADALSIKLSGQRSAGDSHEDTVLLMEEIVASSEEKKLAINQLRRIIEEKTRVSYMGELYSPSQTKDMWKQLVRFRRWAIFILDR